MAFDKERVRQAQRLNKQLTQAGDAQNKSTFDALRKDIEARSKVSSKESAKQAENARKLAQYTDISYQANQRNLAAERELQIKKQQILDIQRRLNITQRAAADRVGVTSAQAKRLGLNMWDAQHAARQFLFTFRRLVGILAVFTLARELASNIAGAAREMISFNRELESSRNAIAQILISVGQVRGPTGELVTGAEAFNIALTKSDELINQLKKDALGSVATFEALVRAYQVAVGPGLASGLDPDQIRVLSKRLTEGAIALGVPLNQLSEEIRSLLQGTATARNTRIAALFGGATEANEAVRNAKEQGNLYEVLIEKLKGVELGANAAESSLAVLQSNLQDSVQLLLAEGGFDAFENFKQAIVDLSNALRDTDPEGNTIFSPQALSVVTELSAVLSTVINGFRNFLQASDVTSVLTNALRSLRGALQAITPAAVTALSALLKGLAAVLDPISEVAAGIGNIVDAVSNSKLGKVFLNIAGSLAAVVLTTKVWVGLLGKAVALTGLQGILGNATSISKSLKGWAIDASLFAANIGNAVGVAR